jgi:NAD(P)-dependent dehydrogenase (short-subunit alcohol dehydrogenase family)
MIELGAFSLKNKSILVTGASSGIGRGTAEVLSKLGANLILAARNEAELKKTMDTLAPGEHRIQILDIINAESRNALVDNLDPVEGVVHCAGVAELVPFRMINEKHMRRIMDTNFEGPVFLTQRLLFKRKIKP